MQAPQFGDHPVVCLVVAPSELLEHVFDRGAFFRQISSGQQALQQVDVDVDFTGGAESTGEVFQLPGDGAHASAWHGVFHECGRTAEPTGGHTQIMQSVDALFLHHGAGQGRYRSRTEPNSITEAGRERVWGFESVAVVTLASFVGTHGCCRSRYRPCT